MVHSNHWYSGNTVGLFLLPPGVTKKQTQHPKELSYLYKGSDCASPVSHELQSNQRFQIDTETKNKLSGVNEIRLTPLQSSAAFAGCMFEYGVRHTLTTGLGPAEAAQDRLIIRHPQHLMNTVDFVFCMMIDIQQCRLTAAGQYTQKRQHFEPVQLVQAVAGFV